MFSWYFLPWWSRTKIRKYLIKENFVETVISLPANLFFGTSIGVNILVLSKHKSEYKTQFIDATGEDFYKKVTNNNMLEDVHIEKIMQLFDAKENVKHVAVTIENKIIEENDYNLSVSSYVEAVDTREVIDIEVLNTELAETVNNISSLRAAIDHLVKEIEG